MPKQRRQSIRGRSTRLNISRAIRAARTRPVAKIRAKPTIRAKGNCTVSGNFLRNFKLAVRHVKRDNTVSTKWWFETIKSIAFTIMKFLATSVVSEAVTEHLNRYPLPLDHPLASSKLLAGAYVTGSITRLCIGPEDLLVESDFVQIQEPATSWLTSTHGIAHYRQAKIDWVKIVITPTTSSAVKEGTFLACLRSMTETEVEQDFENLQDETFTWDELIRAPGCVVKTALTPTTLQWSPTPRDWGYNWMTIGSQKQDSSKYGIGGEICLYLDIGYQNWTSTDGDPSKEYSADKALFDVTIEAHVSLREYETETYTRAFMLSTVKPNEVGISSWGKHVENVPIDTVSLHHGMMLYDATPADMEVV